MVYSQVVFSADGNVPEQVIPICEKVKSLNNRAIGRVLERDNRIIYLVRLKGSKYVTEGRKRGKDSILSKAFKSRLSLLLAAKSFPPTSSEKRCV